MFEEEMRRYLGARSCLFVSSGRTALVSILRAMKGLSGPGRDEVVLPSYTCYSVPAAVVRAGLKVRLCDVDPATLDYDREALARTDFRRVLCLVSTSLYGIPNDLPSLVRRAREAGVFLVDDAAQCLGATIEGRSVGTFGDAGVYSFDKGKSITSIEGGVVVCSSDVLVATLPCVLQGLATPSAAERALRVAKLIGYAAFLKPALYGIPARIPSLGLGTTVYSTEFPLETYTPELGAMAARLFGRLPEINARRVEIARRLGRELNGVPGLRMVTPHPGSTPVYLRYPILLTQPEGRGELVSRLKIAGLGVSTSYPTALDAVPDLRPALVNGSERFPGGAQVARSIVTLPTHAYVREHDLSRTVAIVGSQPVCGAGRPRPCM
ncbi:MAG TPA: DegT/DnrJ/EryC1/StrS family aminotransferase [Candidatus Methanoperedens sp.]|nr:DegT/DnrJ/EryC1/StrS family aminotransferase [Candidatus Methanoperedens sp.]